MNSVSWWIKNIAAGGLIGTAYYACFSVVPDYFFCGLISGVGWLIAAKLGCWYGDGSNLDKWKIELGLMLALNILGAAVVGLIFKTIDINFRFAADSLLFHYTTLNHPTLVINGFVAAFALCAGMIFLQSNHYAIAFALFCAPTLCNCGDMLQLLAATTYLQRYFYLVPFVLVGNLFGTLVFAEIYKLIVSNLKLNSLKFDFLSKLCYNYCITRERKPVSLNIQKTILKENSKEILKIMEEKKITVTEKGLAILTWMQENDNGEDGYFGADIAEATGFNKQGIHGVLNALVKAGLVAKGSREAAFEAKDGTKGVKPYTTYYLTEAGREYRA